jgi:hypothetical protein
MNFRKTPKGVPWQMTLMKYDPATRKEKPYPSHAQQWREYHGQAAFLFCPWTGILRDAYDVASDPFGLLISPPGEDWMLAEKPEKAMKG